MKSFISLFAFFLLFPAFCMSEGIYGSLLRYVDTAPFILVNKRCLTLSLVDENGNPIREYGISCGINYGDKQHPGDNRTPEGIFHICQLLKGTIYMFTLNLLQLTDFQLEHVFYMKKPHV